MTDQRLMLPGQRPAAPPARKPAAGGAVRLDPKEALFDVLSVYVEVLLNSGLDEEAKKIAQTFNPETGVIDVARVMSTLVAPHEELAWRREAMQRMTAGGEAKAVSPLPKEEEVSRVFLDPTPDRLNEMYRNERRSKGYVVETGEEIPVDREDLRRYYASQLRFGDTSLLDISAEKPIGG